MKDLFKNADYDLREENKTIPKITILQSNY